MSLRKNLNIAGVTLCVIFTCGAAAFAQQQTQQPTGEATIQQERQQSMGRLGKRPGGRGGGMHGMGRIISELNLTDAQKQQAHAIFERYGANSQTQRTELRQLMQKRGEGTLTADDELRAKTLRKEMHDSMQNMRTELSGILTPEQRTQLEQIEKERKARHDEMKQRRMAEPNEQQ
ncbi:MAG: Spy/CpxP family protein refolding chaperone [Pyrinomonadaceae bacterium]